MNISFNDYIFIFHTISTLLLLFHGTYCLGVNSINLFYDICANSVYGYMYTKRWERWKENRYFVGLGFWNEGCAYVAESLCHSISVSEIEEILSIAIWYKGINLNMILKTNSHTEHAEHFRDFNIYMLYFRFRCYNTLSYGAFTTLFFLNFLYDFLECFMLMYLKLVRIVVYKNDLNIVPLPS